MNVASIKHEILEGRGYVLIPEVLSITQANEARSLVLQHAAQEKQQGKLLIDGKRERLYSLLYRGKIFEQMVQHPLVLEVVEAILGSEITLGGFSAHILHPGATEMGVHVDYPYWAMEPPFPKHPVMEVQAIWMVEDFTENNGAPLFAPESQKRCSLPSVPDFNRVAQKITGQAGSVVLSHGLAWHNTSANTANEPRVSILGNYALKFVRPLENPFREARQEVLDRASPKLKELLSGYD
ncbi:MAG: phytanoyl-CoA dioxygenase family protein [Cyanophyceae cyanobacterium]